MPTNASDNDKDAIESNAEFFQRILKECAARRAHIMFWWAQRPTPGSLNVLHGFGTTTGVEPIGVKQQLLYAMCELVDQPFPTQHRVNMRVDETLLGPCLHCSTPVVICGDSMPCCMDCCHNMADTERPSAPPTEPENDKPEVLS